MSDESDRDPDAGPEPTDEPAGDRDEFVMEDPDRRETIDPALVRSMVEERGGYPAHVPGSEGSGDHGLLRIGDRDADDDLEEISWEQFEAEFEQKRLKLVYPADEATIDEFELQER